MQQILSQISQNPTQALIIIVAVIAAGLFFGVLGYAHDLKRHLK